MTSAIELESSSKEGAIEQIDLDDSLVEVITEEAPTTRRDLRRERRRQWWGDLGLEVLVALIGVGAIAAGFLGFGLSKPSLNERRSEPLTRATPSVQGSPVPVFTLLVVEGPFGQPASLALLVPEVDRSGGDVIFVPLGIMAEVPSFGLRPLREVPGLGHDELLAETVANMLAMLMDQVDVVTNAELVDVATRLGPITVDLETSVAIPRELQTRPDGQNPKRKLGPGPTKVEPAELAILFGGMEAESELDRIVRHQAIWEALLDRVGDAASSDSSSLSDGGFMSALSALGTGETTFHVMPVESISGGTDGSDELFRLRSAETDELLKSLGGPSAGNLIEVQLQNGTGTPGLAQEIVPLLTAIGAQVALTGNAARFDYKTTLVVYRDPQDRISAEEIQAALGLGEVVRSRSSAMLVDVTVIMGQDLQAHLTKAEAQPDR